MNEWDEIRDRCPKLYRNCSHFECGIGWFDLISDLSSDIEKILDENSENSEIFASQIKEKYGTLRFYMSCENDKITNLIHQAEKLSSQTCENCGEFAKIRGDKWFKVRCDDCFSGEK